MVHSIPFEQSAGMLRENEAQREPALRFLEEFRANPPAGPADYSARYRNSPEGLQMQRFLSDVPPGARLLDVGAGFGFIAVHLAAQGYRVCATEVSPDLCALIEEVARRYDLPITVYHVSGEFLDRLPVKHFDVCMFNASLHHCDEPVRALVHCRTLLGPAGRLFLLNEPLLQFFRSKAWFARQLAEGKLVAGDYGGNEHTYSYREYRTMLRQAGFAQVRDFVAYRYTHPESYLSCLSRHHASLSSIYARKLYYAGMRALCGSGMLGKPALAVLQRLSLLQTDFIAQQRAA